MKRPDFAFIIITTVALLAASRVQAAVKVEPQEPAGPDETKVETKAAPAGPGERLVAFGPLPISLLRRTRAMPSIWPE